MTKSDRAKIIKMIGIHTSYDESTVTIHKNGDISAKLDPKKTGKGPHAVKLLVCHFSDFFWPDKAWRNPFG